MWRVGCWLLMVILAGCNLGTVPADEPTVPTVGVALTCDQMVMTALQSVGSTCAELGRNQACYGNNRVEVQLQPNATGRFAAPGDILDLLAIQRLTTFSLDTTAQTWGIALLKAQANIPDSLPGQNLTFLLYGDAMIDNVSPQMSAVVLRTGGESLTCADAPPSAALVQSTTGTPVTLNINGANISLASTLYITALQNAEMEVATIEGSAIVSAFNTTRIVLPGAKVGLPLSGPNGLQVNGPPSEPEPFDLALVQTAPLTLLDNPVQVPPPVAPTTATPPPTSTVVVPVATNPVVCVPRADWTAAYTIQRGDTLFSIAARHNVSLSQLQQGNCITDPNRIQVGQVLRVPFQLPTAIPPTRPVASTPTPTVPILRADKTFVLPKECALISWEVYNVSQVYFEGQPVSAVGRQQVCPAASTTYTLLVIHPDGKQIPYTMRVEVALPTDSPPVQTPDPASR